MELNPIVIAYVGALVSFFCAVILAVQTLRKQASRLEASRATRPPDSSPTIRRAGSPAPGGTVILAPMSRPSGRSQSDLSLVLSPGRRF